MFFWEENEEEFTLFSFKNEIKIGIQTFAAVIESWEKFYIMNPSIFYVLRRNFKWPSSMLHQF